MEKDFAKYREDNESRVDSLKTEISILQKHYDALQNSGDLDSQGGDKLFGFGSATGGNSQDKGSADLLKIIEDYSR